MSTTAGVRIKTIGMSQIIDKSEIFINLHVIIAICIIN